MIRDRSLLAMPHRLPRFVLAALACALLAACVSVPSAGLPEPLRPPLAAVPEPAALAEAATAEQRTRILEGPRGEAAPARLSDPRRTPVRPGGRPVAFAVDGANLSAFIDEVFGNQLGFSLEIEQAVRDKADLVSLRLVQPEPPHRVYEIAEEVLRGYGIAIQVEDGRLRFTAEAGAATQPPLLFSGRNLPEVPPGQRPVFVLMPLDVVQPGRIAASLRGLFTTGSGPASLQVTELVESNALLLSGPPALVDAALEAAQLLDRTGLRERRSLRITPAFLSPEVLAKELRDVLAGQGFSLRDASGGGVLTLVPVASANALIVFSESEPALQAVQHWVEVLDQPTDTEGPQAGAFIFQARHTTAASLMNTAIALMGGAPMTGTPGATAAPPSAPPGAGGFDQPNPAARQGLSAPEQNVTVAEAPDGSRLVVDPMRNALVFQGDAARWRALQSVLLRLDQPARQVLIEVTVAEVTLTDEFSHGVEWALRQAGINDYEGPLSAFAGNVPARGVVWRPVSSSGQVRAVLNLFQNDGRVSILSTPRLMVSSGEQASIDVGTEVPILTSQATAPDLGGVTPSILQQVQYRKTGVILTVAPVVHSSQRVDLRISQEVSEAQETQTSTIASPSIFSRRLETVLSLQDGEAMLMGGLISDTRTQGGSRVPLLGDLPVLGELFRSRNRRGTRTELLVLITPYVVEDAAQARAITEALRGRMNELPR